jgi:hypothetical protein
VASGNALAKICREYCEIYERFRDRAVAQEKAPYFEDPVARSNELKSMAPFFDATLIQMRRRWLAAPAIRTRPYVQQPLTRAAALLVPLGKAARYSSFRKYFRYEIGLRCD